MSFDQDPMVSDDLYGPVSFGGGGGGGGGDGGGSGAVSTRGAFGQAVRGSIGVANDIANNHPGMTTGEVMDLSFDPEANAYGHPDGDAYSGGYGRSNSWDGR